MNPTYTDSETSITVAMYRLAPGRYEVTQYDSEVDHLIERSPFAGPQAYNEAMDRFDLIVRNFF